MRFNQLNLIRYGKFSNFSIDLPAPFGDNKPDFHLVVGANEAGKSTTRHAISDLLFGIEARTRFDFLHAKSDMCLGAILEYGDDQLEYQRLKRNKQPLQNPDGTSLPDDALAKFTGNADRTSFEREFCLDHKRLEAGGKSILNSKDDVGRMLFEASAGVGVFGDLLDKLEEEAGTLWTSRHSKDREFYKAHNAFKEAQKVLKESITKTTEWKNANQKVANALEALNKAGEEYRELEQIRTQIDRVRRVAPHLQARKVIIDERIALGDVTLLPESATEDLATTKNEIASANQQIIKYQALIAKASEDLNSFSVDENLLASKEDIDELSEEKSRIKNHQSDIGKREAESQTLSDNIQGLVRDLGWTNADERSLEEALPSALLRKDIESLANSYSGLCQAEINTNENARAKQHSLGVLIKERDQLPATQFPSSIASSLNAARELGNIGNNKADIDARIKLVQDTYNAHVAKLTPWAGSMEELLQLAVPGDIQIEEFKNSDRDIFAKLTTLKERREEVNGAIKSSALEESQLQMGTKPVTTEDIETSRRGRDQIWSNIRSGTKTSEKYDEFESLVKTSDELADSRYRNASDAKELEHLHNNIARSGLERDRLDEKIVDVEDQHRKLMDEWQRVMDRLNLTGMNISAFLSWFGNYRIAVGEAEKIKHEQAHLQKIHTQETMATIELRQALLQHDISAETISTFTLQQLIERAQTEVSTAEKLNSRREQLNSDILQSTQSFENLTAKAVDAKQQLKVWQETWSEKIRACKLPDSIIPKNAIEALSLMNELKEKLVKNRDLKQSRIMTMQRDIENFSRCAETLAQTVASELVGRPAEEICRVLSQRLREADKAKSSNEKALNEVNENTLHLGKAQKLVSEANLRLTPYMDRVESLTIEDLETAIEQSDYYRILTSKIDEITTTINENGDGLSIEYLETEISAEDLSTIAARLDEVKQKSNAALLIRDHCVLQNKEAEIERDRIKGQANAATAEAQRQDALAQMAVVTQRFIKVLIGAHMLRWCIERYRDEKRGPLLARASKIFSILTLDSFRTLSIDFDGDIPQLMGCRPDGTHVDFDGLSDGTADQLFLSLRLAAVEMQLQHTQPLPFIADDLFINYSDNRAALGFKVLSDLARKSQVIYFSHHGHLVDIAREAIGGEMNVTRLESENNG
ncbi:MAG: AAA family ATPase [Hyphomicrobiales bacterium]|nr:AAA family ATPase [Hyphomicrobiales bacterium]